MIPINPCEELELLAGTTNLQVRPIEPYHELVCEFLDELSKRLLENGRAYPDVGSFAFWCRKGNIQKLKQAYKEPHARLGLGLVFHVTPSNVPINFAFSYGFSLIAGNANLVRVPSKKFGQVELVCNTLKTIFENKKYTEIYNQSAFIRYKQNDSITSRFSEISHARVIWGGNETVRHVRSLPSMERTIDITFADRFSICVLDAPSINKLTESQLKSLAEDFYNDTYLMDQNACSSPHLIIWQGPEKASAKSRFWSALAHSVKERQSFLSPVHVIDKYTLMCQNLIESTQNQKVSMDNQFVYRVELRELSGDVDKLRGRFGLFYEYDVDSLVESDVLMTIVNTKYQTLTYFGVNKLQLVNCLIKHHLLGVDRIVPVGKALDIGVFWDGFDIVKSLSRVIFVQ